jgi:hypothetical protein
MHRGLSPFSPKKGGGLSRSERRPNAIGPLWLCQRGVLFRFIRLFGGMTRNRGDFSRHHSDVPGLHGDLSLCCNTTARRSGGRLCWEATCQGISWSPMRPWRVSLWPRISARGLLDSRPGPHRSHASLNPYAVRHFKIPPNSRMNPLSGLRTPVRPLTQVGAARLTPFRSALG